MVLRECLAPRVNSSLGEGPDNPAGSCKHLAVQRSDSPSGYYWIGNETSSIEVYCEMDHTPCDTTRGWTQIVNFTVQDNTTECPGEFELVNGTSGYACERPDTAVTGCSSAYFSVHGIEYTQISGRVYGYQVGYAYGFYDYYAYTIDDPYLAGVSVTTGTPRTHVWSFAAGEIYIGQQTRELVGNDFFCESGQRYYYYYDYSNYNGSDNIYEYFDDYPYTDILWDGEGCADSNSLIQCCRRAPWFCKELSEPSTSDIEVRICRNDASSNSMTRVVLLELYIQ